MRLSLIHPERLKQEAYPANCVPVLPKHDFMMYWVDKFGFFNKTPRENVGQIRDLMIKSALDRETKIINHFGGKSPSEFMNIPSHYSKTNGNLVISQIALDDGDFLNYLLDDPANCGINASSKLLICLQNILPVLHEQRIHYGDFALENFMVKKDKYGNLEKLILIDFGQSEIFDKTKSECTWKFKEYCYVRRHLLPPDMETKYNISCEMKSNDMLSLLMKKDMFVFGVLLYTTLKGSELWSSDIYTSSETKIDDLRKLHIYWRDSIMKKMIPKKKIILFKILLGLLPINLVDMISLPNLFSLIDELHKVDTLDIDVTCDEKNKFEIFRMNTLNYLDSFKYFDVKDIKINHPCVDIINPRKRSLPF